MDIQLKKYLSNLKEKTGYRFPSFDDNASIKAEVLCVLQDPGHSGAERSLKCSLNNNDPTARRQRDEIKKVNISEDRILMWNFYAAFDLTINKKNNLFWASQIDELIEILPNLKVIVVFGKKTWEGMFNIKNLKKITILSAPHPSNRGMNDDGASEKLPLTWKSVQEIID
ncbi:hypothetical protein N8753_01380 [Pelagibacteraceae bacterium]|nr:hypothetical protein [Pelagibacteraceae bacterium]